MAARLNYNRVKTVFRAAVKIFANTAFKLFFGFAVKYFLVFKKRYPHRPLFRRLHRLCRLRLRLCRRRLCGCAFAAPLCGALAAVLTVSSAPSAGCSFVSACSGTLTSGPAGSVYNAVYTNLFTLFIPEAPAVNIKHISRLNAVLKTSNALFNFKINL